MYTFSRPRVTMSTLDAELLKLVGHKTNSRAEE